MAVVRELTDEFIDDIATRVVDELGMLPPDTRIRGGAIRNAVSTVLTEARKIDYTFTVTIRAGSLTEANDIFVNECIRESACARRDIRLVGFNNK